MIGIGSLLRGFVVSLLAAGVAAAAAESVAPGAGAAPTDTAVESASVPPADGDGDPIGRVDIVESDRNLGTVGVFKLHDGVLVRTVLRTNLLKRVVAQLAVKVEEGWPAGAEHDTAARQFAAALEAARDEIWSRWRALSTRERGSQTQTLVIEFTLTLSAATVAVLTADTDADDSLRLSVRELLSAPDLPDAFVRAEGRRVVMDRFGDTADDLIARIPAAAPLSR